MGLYEGRCKVTLGSKGCYKGESCYRGGRRQVIIDYHSWDPAPYGTNRFWPGCWPEPRQMVADAAAAGVELMVSPYFTFIGENSRGP